MSVAESLLATDSFWVEVSGWDESQVFFVEKSGLDWDNFAGKHISLQHMLSDGVMVFLRVLQPTDMRQSPTAAYRVKLIGCNPDGQHQFRPSPVHPRYSRESLEVN